MMKSGINNKNQRRAITDHPVVFVNSSRFLFQNILRICALYTNSGDADNGCQEYVSHPLKTP